MRFFLIKLHLPSDQHLRHTTKTGRMFKGIQIVSDRFKCMIAPRIVTCLKVCDDYKMRVPWPQLHR